MYSPALTDWRAQYKRMERGHGRLTTPYTSSVAYDDDIQHYFQDCWHLKDWIKNDPTSNVGVAIEAEVSAHQSLRVVADLANGSKHLARNKHREGAYVTSSSVTVHLAQSKPIDIEYVVSLSNGATLSAQAIVKESFAAWGQVLAKLGLKP